MLLGTLGLLLALWSTAGGYQIAVCVSGQISRWIPEYLRSGLINPNPNHFFHLFINLQYHTDNDLSSVFTTNSLYTFEPTPINSLKGVELLQYVHKLYTSDHSQVVSMEFVPPKSLSDWKAAFKGFPALDRISLYTKKQHAILSLYAHQRRCYEQIKVFEDLAQTKVDFVLNTREDIYYFQPLDLTGLLPNHQTPFLNTSSTPVSLIQNSPKHAFCDLVAKNCLKWNGTNMRWQLFSHDHSEKILQKRFHYYRYLYRLNTSFRNPESFEYNQYHHYRINICEYPIEMLPVAAIRYVGQGRTCFIPQEIGDRCVPSKFADFVKSNKCNQFANQTITAGTGQDKRSKKKVGKLM